MGLPIQTSKLSYFSVLEVSLERLYECTVPTSISNIPFLSLPPPPLIMLLNGFIPSSQSTNRQAIFSHTCRTYYFTFITLFNLMLVAGNTVYLDNELSAHRLERGRDNCAIAQLHTEIPNQYANMLCYSKLSICPLSIRTRVYYSPLLQYAFIAFENSTRISKV